jgi:2-amino-4-hydroxy-6-hydroxymethyldihydropteridine diphosphokinase
MPRTAVIALGSNLDDRAGNVRRAVEELGALGRVTAVSSLYESAPVGPVQPDYLNAVALLETDLAPDILLRALLGIEAAMGRVRGERWGPRRIDLDLVAVDDLAADSPELTLPHPEAHRRAFVLVPLAEVAPEFVLPGRGPVRALVAQMSAAQREGVRGRTA